MVQRVVLILTWLAGALSNGIELVGKVPLTLCCSHEDVYRVGLDVCREWAPSSGSRLDHVLLPVYSGNETVAHADLERFNLTRNLSTCPAGYYGKSSSQFRLFQNGTLEVSQISLFQPGNFCIAHLPDGDFVSRFCAPDPCHGSNCLRKCCPKGSAVNLTAKVCQSSDIPFQVTYRNTEGDIIDPDPSLIVRDGASPNCPHGINVYDPSSNPEDEFNILANGRMYIPFEERTIDADYCVDQFFDESESAGLQALICFPPPQEDAPDDQLALAIFPYFFFGSTIFLVATFVVYAAIPELRNIHGVTIMSYVAAMTVAYVGLANIQMHRDNHNIYTCQGLAVITHFTFLAIFSWLNMVSFDIWWTFRSMRPANSNNNGRHRLGLSFILYSLYGWGVPFVIVLVGQVLDHLRNLPSSLIRPRFGLHKCWFGSREALLVYLYGPAAILIMSNVVFFFMTAILIHRASMDTAFAAGRHHAQQRFRVIFSLFLLMGLSWMTEIISYGVGGDAYNWFFTDIVNILTGVYVFIIFVCKPKVWKLLKLKYPFLERLAIRCRRIRRRICPKKNLVTPSVSRTISTDTTVSRTIDRSASIISTDTNAGKRLSQISVETNLSI